MIESKVILDRKDYVSICERIRNIKTDITLYKKSNDERCLDAIEKEITSLENILEE